jgi:hypothetical protein
MGKNSDVKPHHVHRESFLEKGKLPPLPGLGGPLAPEPPGESPAYGATRLPLPGPVVIEPVEREQPIDPQLSRTMNELASFLAEELKPNGFSLLVFPFAKDTVTSVDNKSVDRGRINYVSNADRKDMLRAMRQFIDKNEAEHGGDRLDAVLVRRYFRALYDETAGKDFDPKHPVVAAVCIIQECLEKMKPASAQELSWIIADLMLNRRERLSPKLASVKRILKKDE